MHTAEGTKEFILNHKIAFFLPILHALLTRIRLEISWDGWHKISTEIDASSKLLTSLEKHFTSSAPRFLLTF